jgi:beta-lactamase regulating signal transducer with metallopeptidase domain
MNTSYFFQCTLFFPTNVTNCNIPCDLTGCTTEVHKSMNCPVWVCSAIETTTTTTTSSSTTSSSTTSSSTTSSSTTSIQTTTTSMTSTMKTTTTPVPNSAYEISIVANFLLAVVIFALILFLIWYWRKKQRQTQVERSQNLPLNPLIPNTHFSLDETSPLISNQSESNNPFVQIPINDNSEVPERNSFSNFFRKFFRRQ